MIDVFSHCFPLRRTAKRLSAVSASFPVVHCGIRLLLLLLLCCCSLLGAACSQDSGTSQETAEIAPSNIFSQRPPKQPARTARNILIVGDSLSISLGEQMERVLSGAPGIDFTRDGTRSTGLTRPELLDWPAHLRELVAHMSPDIVVIMIGANDAMPVEGQDGARIYFDSPAWPEAYAAKAKQLIAICRQANPRVAVYWVGVPPMRILQYQLPSFTP